jgi:hypothetical protein
LWDQPAFSAAGVDYEWIDVALWAMAHGEWAAFERRLAEGLACLNRARVENATPSDDELDEAAVAFRYDRDLLAASEMNEWLDQVGLTVDDWSAYLTRELLRQRWHHSLAATLQQYPPAAPQLVEAAFVEGICSKTFAAFEEGFCARVAMAAACGPLHDHGASPLDEAERIAERHDHWLQARSVVDVEERLNRVLRIESHFTAAVDRVIARTPLHDIVQQHRLQWQQVELDTLHFSSEHAAREALLCVTVDRLSLHDVAALARRSADRRLFFVDELDAEQRDRVLSVDPGSVLGPIAVNGHFEVSSVVRRTPPAVSDERVAARARKTIIDAAIRSATRDHVTRRSRE